MAVRTSADAPPWEQFDPVIVQEAVADIQLKFRSNFSHPSTHTNVDIRDLDLIQSDPNFVKKFVQQEYLVSTGSNLPNSTQIYEIVLKALEFRYEYHVHDITVRDISPLVLRTGFCYTHGMDKQGNTISYLIVRKNRKDPELKKASKLYAVYLVYQHSLLCPDQLMTLFIDSTGAGVSNMDLDLIRFLINLFRYYFPLRMGWMLIHNLPWVLTATWNIVKRWLPPKSRDRIVFTTSTDISLYISPDQLLSEYGGDVNWSYKYPIPANEADTLQGRLIYLGDGDDDDSALLSSFEATLGNGKMTAGDLLDNIGESQGFTPTSPLTPTMSEISFKRDISVQHLVDVSPRDMLVFSLNTISNRNSCVKISVRNVSPSTVSFKLKATNLSRYKVSPTIGVIEPDHSSSVSITLDLANRHDLALLAADVSKDRFLIMTSVFPVDRPTTPVHILRFWRRLDKQEINNCIFSARFDYDSKRFGLDPQIDLDETAELAKLKSKFNSIQCVLSDVAKKQKFVWHTLLLLCVQFVFNFCLLSWRYR